MHRAIRTGTEHDHRERLNQVLFSIQDNIDRPLSLAELAAAAHFSPFHFHCIFSACMGESLCEHLRRVRLENAAKKLARSDGRVTEIALAAGYETPASFAKAFRQIFGKSPTDFAKMKADSRRLTKFSPQGSSGTSKKETGQSLEEHGYRQREVAERVFLFQVDQQNCRQCKVEITSR